MLDAFHGFDIPLVVFALVGFLVLIFALRVFVGFDLKLLEVIDSLVVLGNTLFNVAFHLDGGAVKQRDAFLTLNC